MKGILYTKRANIFFVKIIIVSVLFVLIAVVLSFFGIKKISKTVSSANQVEFESITVIIDPGHGGIDAGAEVDSICEKDLNLAVAKKISSFLSMYRVNCVLTRDSDVLLSDDGAPLKKQSDLLNRVNIAKAYPSGVFVSIHMNKYPVEKYNGLQVFYSSNNDKSKTLAQTIQESVVNTLQKDNNRQIKESGSTIFVLDRLLLPAVLVECGFMSNSNELKLLTDSEYQDKLAYIISVSILQFLSL